MMIPFSSKASRATFCAPMNTLPFAVTAEDDPGEAPMFPTHALAMVATF